jgi:hypothetical protein
MTFVPRALQQERKFVPRTLLHSFILFFYIFLTFGFEEYLFSDKTMQIVNNNKKHIVRECSNIYLCNILSRHVACAEMKNS